MYKHKRRELYITTEDYNKLSFFKKLSYEYYQVEDTSVYFKGTDHKFHKIGAKGLEWHI